MNLQTAAPQETMEDDSHTNLENMLPEFPWSPPPPSRSTKAKKPPPITPRRFNRFFDPRSSRGSNTPRSSCSGRILGELTSNAINNLFANSQNNLGDFDNLPSLRSSKRRKTGAVAGQPRHGAIFESSSPIRSSPLPSSPCNRGSPRRAREVVQAIPFQTCQRIRRSRIIRNHISDFRSQTAQFCSIPEDIHQFSPAALPFCTASCNTNSLVAIGDEEGDVRIVESVRGGKPGFGIPYVSFRPHDNAIIQLDFSSDDRWLATASGDQTAKIIDMPTQTPFYILAEHTSSLKQVTFQPGNDNVVATCSRDGIVALWDLRCNSHSAVANIETERAPQYASKMQSIIGGHSEDGCQSRTSNKKRMEPSITALQFLSPTRPHLFLTSSDSSARLRLWDVRGRYSNRRSPPVPITTSGALQSHEDHRQHGISSLAISSDHARLYAVCKDSTVYAYSTNHLILGQAPELSPAPPQHWAQQRGGEGLGPLFGLRHPKFRTSSFYVRAAVRKASEHFPELLAVGNSEGSPVLFPTDERSLKRSGVLPQRKRKDDMPIYDSGTALVRGHAREVTSVSWTLEGDLVTVGDDYTARCWREDAQTARELRIGGESEGRRWGCGWAEVEDASWDEGDR